jgi:hypothetical protein
MDPGKLEDQLSLLARQRRVSFDLMSVFGMNVNVTLQTLQVAEGYELHWCEIFVKR